MHLGHGWPPRIESHAEQSALGRGVDLLTDIEPKTMITNLAVVVEHAYAATFCQREPTAIVTWRDEYFRRLIRRGELWESNRGANAIYCRTAFRRGTGLVAGPGVEPDRDRRSSLMIKPLAMPCTMTAFCGFDNTMPRDSSVSTFASPTT